MVVVTDLLRAGKLSLSQTGSSASSGFTLEATSSALYIKKDGAECARFEKDQTADPSTVAASTTIQLQRYFPTAPATATTSTFSSPTTALLSDFYQKISGAIQSNDQDFLTDLTRALSTFKVSTNASAWSAGQPTTSYDFVLAAPATGAYQEVPYKNWWARILSLLSKADVALGVNLPVNANFRVSRLLVADSVGNVVFDTNKDTDASGTRNADPQTNVVAKANDSTGVAINTNHLTRRVFIDAALFGATTAEYMLSRTSKTYELRFVVPLLAPGPAQTSGADALVGFAAFSLGGQPAPYASS